MCNEKTIIEAVLCGDLALDAALEQQLDDDDADMESIHAALCYANLGQLDRVVDLPSEPTVAQVVEQFSLGCWLGTLKPRSAFDEADSQCRWRDLLPVYPRGHHDFFTNGRQEMIALKTPLFKPGQVLATPGAIDALEKLKQSVWPYLSRHLAGDWGDLSADDKTANDESLKDGSRILSAYILEGEGDDATKLWLITEAADESGHRVATTALLPEDY